ncbi:MAG: cation:dicarboxylase symporter family transporter [Eubacteriales bacterium]|nr:cation:dicarboxylase symporter family transporter [Eubacteriales bacterium]
MKHKTKVSSVKRSSYTLSAENIDNISELLRQYLADRGMERKNITGIRLVMEDILLRWQAHCGEETELTISEGSQWGRPFIAFSVAGDDFNPCELSDEQDDFALKLVAALNLSFRYVYQKGRGVVCFSHASAKPNPLRTILFSVLLAVAAGLGASHLPSSAVAFCLAVATPVYNAFLHMLGCIAGPMIFLSVVYGVYSIGNISTLGTIGLRMIRSFVGNIFLTTLLAGLLMLPLVNLNLAGGVQTEQLQSIYQMILDIIPSNIVEPFMTGNSLQIIFMAVVLGVALIVLQESASVPAELCRQLNGIVGYLMKFISDLVPGFVFLCLFKMIVSGAAMQIVSSWKIVLVFAAITALLLAEQVASTSLRYHVSLGVLIKKMLPVFTIGLSTASSSAAFGTNVYDCEESFGISRKLVQFGVPLGTIIYKPAGAVRFMVLGVMLALQYDVSISIAWMATAVVVTAILAMAAPPIPGGALTCFSVLFMQLGIPEEALVLAMTMNVFLDFLITAGNLGALQLSLVRNADGLNMLNRDTLTGGKA